MELTNVNIISQLFILAYSSLITDENIYENAEVNSYSIFADL